MSSQQVSNVASTERGFAATRAQDDSNAAATFDYSNIVRDLNRTFNTGKTRSVKWRRQQLEKLREGLLAHHEEVTAAVRADHGGPKLRGAVELSCCDEINFTLKHLDSWAAPRKVPNPMMENPNGSAEVVPTPKGTVLLISPWNYPISLCLKPLVTVIAAGNCCVMKPSEVAPHSAAFIKRLVEEYLDPSAFRVVLGGVAETTALLREPYAHIVYTGNGDVARIIMKAASAHLTPCTLELGGKSPVIIDSDADIDLAARRVAFGKWGVNAGQTCIAPDYVLVHRKVQSAFIEGLKAKIAQFFPQGADQSKDFGRIINSRHVARIRRILAQSSGGQVVVGGESSINPDKCFVPPTVVLDPSLDDVVMREEIFGPVLPVVCVDSIDEALSIVDHVCPRPLALYMFTKSDKTQRRILDESLSGGVVINGCNFEQYANSSLPFGGIGTSGTGELHGEHGFNNLSHLRAVVRKSQSWPFNKIDLPPPPYTDDLYEKFIKLKYTGFFSPTQIKLAKIAGIGALLLTAGAIRSRL